jgi:hypothetical protein
VVICRTRWSSTIKMYAPRSRVPHS